MTKPRQPLTLQAHANVTNLDEARRARALLDPAERVIFVDFCEAQPENAPAASPERRWRAGWLRAILGLGKRSRAS